MRMLENITKRKDGRFMGRFPIGRGGDGKLLYQFVYGNTYEEAETKLMIGKAIESEYLSGRSVSVKQAYTEWINAAANRVKESRLPTISRNLKSTYFPHSVICCAASCQRVL